MEQKTEEPVVSVFCMTYNQENTIAQAIEGVLAQKTDFPVELIVHDDASTDKTAAIVRDYAVRYPQKVRAIFQTENQYQKSNFWQRFLLPISYGDYIAICEGDDFWTDTEKLQRQVAYMRAHRECAMCFHAVEQLDKSGKVSVFRPLKKTDTVAAKTLIRRGGMFCPTVSMLFRRDVMAKWPTFRRNADVYDYPAQVLAATMGSVYYIDRVMATYRYAFDGSWTARQACDADIAHAENETRWLTQFDTYTKGAFRQDVDYHLALLWLAAYRKNQSDMIKNKAKSYICRLSGKDKWVMHGLFVLFRLCRHRAERVWQAIRRYAFR